MHSHAGLTFGVAKNVTLVAVRALDCLGQASYTDVITVSVHRCHYGQCTQMSLRSVAEVQLAILMSLQRTGLFKLAT